VAAIGYGEGNATPRKRLISATGISDRLLRKHIETLRRSGVVIAASDKGYYSPADLSEVTAYRRQEERRAKSTLFTLKAARRLEARLRITESGQINL